MDKSGKSGGNTVTSAAGNFLNLVVTTILLAFIVGIPFGMMSRNFFSTMYSPNANVVIQENETE